MRTRQKNIDRAIQQLDDTIESLEARKRSLEYEISDVTNAISAEDSKDVRTVKQLMLGNAQRALEELNVELARYAQRKATLEGEQRWLFIVFIVISLIWIVGSYLI